ncbi:MAG: hypothetical protein HYY01_10340 [Chloroflexi bacterium]|nr:hypothetical protein [Chloroflexota bacterium]
MPDNIHSEQQRFWADYQSVGALMERGLLLPALERLSALRSHPRKPALDPNRNVDYSYAVLLQQASPNADDWRTSAAILKSMIEDAQSGSLQFDEVLLRIELASAMILLREFEAAAEVATEAIELSEKGHKARALAFQNLGRTLFELGRLNEAHATYLKMIEAGLHEQRLVFAGIGAEWLARIAVRNSRLDEAATRSIGTRPLGTAHPDRSGLRGHHNTYPIAMRDKPSSERRCDNTPAALIGSDVPLQGGKPSTALQEAMSLKISPSNSPGSVADRAALGPTPPSAPWNLG